MEIIWPHALHKPKLVSKRSCNPNVYHTFVVVDDDAPKPPFLHYLKINIRCTEEGKDTIMSWLPPMPPQGESHHYTARLYEQSKYFAPFPVKYRESFKWPVDKHIRIVSELPPRLANSKGFSQS